METAILTIDGIDYVLDKYLEAKSYELVRSSLNLIPLATVDQWPEEIEIQDSEDHCRRYVRADVIFFKDGKEFDLRLLPQTDCKDSKD
jgi:hypothetical protein